MVLHPATFVELNETERRGLLEINAACQEALRINPRGGSWTRASRLSGTSVERSSKNIRKLAAYGFVDINKLGGSRQAKLYIRLTDKGIAWVFAWMNGQLPCYNERDGLHRAALDVVLCKEGALERLTLVMNEAMKRAEHRKSRIARRAAAA